MPLIEESVVVSCPLGRAFDFATDPVNTSRFNRTVIESRRVDRGVLGAGSQVHCVARVAGHRLEYDYEIVEFQPPTRCVIATTASPIMFTVSMRFSAVNRDTIIDWTIDSERFGSFFGYLSESVVSSIYARDLRSTLAELKRLLESDPADLINRR